MPLFFYVTRTTIMLIIKPILKYIAPIALAAALIAPAQAKEDASHFLITPAFVQKLKAADAEMKKYKKDDEDDEKDDGKDDSSIEGIMKKIDSDPRIKGMLAKHGITSREYAHATYAMLHAGMYVAMEKMMDKKKGEAAYNSYTKEQKANIAFMRTWQQQQGK